MKNSLLNRFKLNNRGDTIVEVMVVLAVLGMAISISYATASKSLQATRASHESAEATVLLQSQLEVTRTLAKKDQLVAANKIYQSSPANLFCINAFNQVTLAALPTDCVFNNRYRVTISYDSTQSDLFTLKAVWDDVSGDTQQDSSTLMYRLPR